MNDINPRPNWRSIPGYAFGLPQSSMIASEEFPKDPTALGINEIFSVMIAEILDGVGTLPDAKANIPVPVVTAKLISSATSMLQNWMSIPVSEDAVVTVANNSTKLNVVLPWWRFDASKKAYFLCVNLWNFLAQGQKVSDVSALRAEWQEQMLQFVSSSVNEYSQIKAIMDMEINLITQPGGIFCLGTGAQSRWMESTTTDHTSGLSMRIARNKHQTALMLQQSGLPGAENKIVSTEEEAVAVALEFSGNVVIKPADQDRGDGVAADLSTEAQIRNAYRNARAFSPMVLVEKMLHGFTHRLTVVNGLVISVRKRVPAGVTGDGKSTLAELIEEYNQSDLGRRWSRRRGRMPLELDAEALDLISLSRFSLDSILPYGQFLRLRRRDNINAGGRNIELNLENEDVHADNLQLAIDAAEVLRLDIAGIDLISVDISKSWREIGAGICEVNARPQFAVRRTPELFQKVITGVTGYDPHIKAKLIVCGDNPSDREDILHTLSKTSINCTIAMKEGVYRDNYRIMGPFNNGFISAVASLTNRNTKAAICIMTLSEILNLGSPLRKWSKIGFYQKGMTGQEKAKLPAVEIYLGLRSTTKA